MTSDPPRQLDLSSLIDGPFIATFTARLPFLLGIPDELGHGIVAADEFADPLDKRRFKGEAPWVNIRVYTHSEAGALVWPTGSHVAIRRFYGVELDGDPVERYGLETLSEGDQWITLETPFAPSIDEDQEQDPAFAFHRCLRVFNWFVQAVLYMTKDIRIRPITSYDLRPQVIVGGRTNASDWRFLTSMYMHPEAMSERAVTLDGPDMGSDSSERPFEEKDLNEALSAMANQFPYLNTILWRTRAQRALRLSGDAADAIISFQVAAESLLYDTYRMLLVDERLSSLEIADLLTDDLPFKSLLATVMPTRLGGQWDVTLEGTLVGDYWNGLYMKRNAIVHGGLQPHIGHAEAAQDAYRGLRDHVEARLWANHTSHPRTVLARFGQTGLESRGWWVRSMQECAARFMAEPGPWHLPHDLAGRAKED